MISRLFSIVRRRPGVVHITVPITPTNTSYNFSWSANFDGVFTSFISASTMGFVDSAIDFRTIQTVSGNSTVGIVFNPATFSIPDTSPFYIQYSPTVGNPSAVTLVLPDRAAVGASQLIISGNAPNVSPLSNSLQIDLPGQCQDMHIHNQDASHGLYVAFDPAGPEMLIQAPDADTQYNSLFGTQSTLFVRGSGAIVAFSASFTLADPR